MLQSLYNKFIELTSKYSSVEQIKQSDPHVQEAIQRIKSGSRIYIWPAAQMGKFIYEKLNSMGYSDTHLLDRNYQSITYAKAESPDGVQFKDTDVLIIATLNHSAFVYQSALEKNCNHLLMYYHLEMLDEHTPMNFPADFHSKLISDLTQHLLDNKNDYCDMYEALADESSKIAFLNNMLFRLTHDVTYTFEYDRKVVQYFDPSLVLISDETVFIDGGGFNGDTLKEFLKFSRNGYQSYYLFEPDGDLVEEARKVSRDNRIRYINKGLYTTTCELRFNKTVGMNGAIDDYGTEIIEVVSIDEAVKEPVTYIKMDIEGAELAALRGAENTIKKYFPTLAICIYHKDSDYLDIFQYIRSINPGYRFYIRHHLNYYAEAVLYAIHDEG